MKRSVFATASLFLLAITGASAETTLITGAKIYTMGPQGIVSNGSLLVEDGRIRAVGAKVELPAGAKVIDATGKIITPGLFVPMGTLGLDEVSMVSETIDNVQRGDQFAASFDIADAFNRRSTLIPITRVEGITHALIAPSSSYPDEQGNSSRIFSGLAAVVDLGDDPDYLTKRAAALVVNLGASGGGLVGGSRAAALLTLRAALDDAKDYSANKEAFDKRQRRDYSVSRADLEVLQDVLTGDIPLIVNIDRASDIETLLKITREYHLRVIINGGAEAWMVADQLAAAKIAVLTRPLQNLPANFDSLNSRRDSAAILAAAGVSIAFAETSAEGLAQNARNITQAAGVAVASGLPWIAALEAITITPARLYGVSDEVGSLEAGKVADFIIWSGDPLELTNYPDKVFIDGHEISMTTRQSLLRDRYLNLKTDKPPAFN